MKRNFFLLPGLALLTGVLANAPGARACNNYQVAVCHIPPGNPSNAHTIAVGFEAVPAHLAHGDCVSTCGISEEQ